MICKKCSNQIADDTKFCPVCGEAVTVDNSQAQDAYQAPNETTFSNQSVTPDNQALPENEQPMFSEGMTAQQLGNAPFSYQPNPKKKKKPGFIIGIIAAVLALILALGGAAYALIPQVRTLFRKTFSSDEDYLQYVVKKNTEGGVSDLTTALGTIKDAYSKNSTSYKTSGAMSVEFDYDSVNKLLEKYAGTSLPEYANQITKVTLDFQGKSSDNKSEAVVNLLLKDNSVISFNMFMDEENIVIQLPDFSEEYLYIPLSTAGDTAEIQKKMTEAITKLPDAEKLKKLIMRYIDLAVSCIDDVEKSTDTISVGDISQKCTKLSVTIDEKDMLKITKTLIEEAKGDGELKKLIEAFAKDIEADFVISDFEDAIDEALDNLDEVELGDASVDLTIWVDGKSDIIGYSIEIPDGNVEFTLLAPKKGQNIACLFEAEIDRQTYGIKFTGTEVKNTINGTAEFRYDNKSYIKLDIKNLNTDEDKDIDTTFTLSLDKGLKNMLSMIGTPDEYSELADGIALVLNVKTGDKGNKAETSFSLTFNGSALAKVSYTLEAKEDSGVKVEMPDITNAYNITDKGELQEYVSMLDMEAILTKLLASLPTELIEAIMNSSVNI